MEEGRRAFYAATLLRSGSTSWPLHWLAKLIHILSDSFCKDLRAISKGYDTPHFVPLLRDEPGIDTFKEQRVQRFRDVDLTCDVQLLGEVCISDARSKANAKQRPKSKHLFGTAASVRVMTFQCLFDEKILRIIELTIDFIARIRMLKI